MYFLMTALLGMRRRLVTAVLMIAGGAALLTAIASIFLWSVWLSNQRSTIKSVRSASVFVDATEAAAVEEVLSKVIQLKGIETARMVSTEEFHDFLEKHFPDLKDAIADLGTDVIPRMLEVVFVPQLHPFSRKETIDAIAAVSGVSRVDDGATHLERAMVSLKWLSLAGFGLSIGLWIVLFIVSMGYYQNILYSERQEILLMRSFGSSKFSMIAPWILEGTIHSFITMAVCLVSLGLGGGYLSDLYNQFFGSLGYEPFRLGVMDFVLIGAAAFVLVLFSHVLGSIVALVRGNIA